ncbi:MAG: hypothetical protein ACMUIP_09880 [bacterium]
MEILKEKDKNQLRGIFKHIKNNVKILMFTQEMECQTCAMSRNLLEEVAALSEKIILETRDFVADAELAHKHRIDKIPAIVLLGDKDYGMRFYGIPAGYEFNTLIEDILDVGKREHGLSTEVMAELAKIDRPVHMQVFISPS